LKILLKLPNAVFQVEPSRAFPFYYSLKIVAPMTEERAKRKLRAILSADAVGYSRLMQEDEASTIRAIEDSKRLMSELIGQFKGRVVDAPGDNLLAEFASVVDATECAVKIQKELKIKSAELPDNRQLKFRIGVNLFYRKVVIAGSLDLTLIFDILSDHLVGHVPRCGRKVTASPQMPTPKLLR
jgi:class 3 adenylate cyclase